MRNEIRFYTSDIQGCELSYYLQIRGVKKVLFFNKRTHWKILKVYGNKKPKNIDKELNKYSKLFNAKIVSFGSGE